MLTAIQSYLNGRESPFVRQQRMEEERRAAVAAAESKLSPRNRRKFHRVLSAAQQAARVREDALFEVGPAWTYLHRIALELGRRLVQKGVIAQPGDVFWLLLDEIRAAFGESGQSRD